MKSKLEKGLPARVVVGSNGAYWRDYGDHYSMPPVSEDNDAVVVVETYIRPGDDDRLVKLGNAIWDKVMLLEALQVTMREGTSANLRIHAEQQIKPLEDALWGDLQTLFRGGRFPEDM